MSLEHTTVIVMRAGPTGLLAAAELAIAGVHVEVIDWLEHLDPHLVANSGLRRDSTSRRRQDVSLLMRSFDQGPCRDHDVKEVLSV